MPLRLWHAARRSPTMIERIPADGRNCRSCVQARGGGHGTLLNARCRLRVRRRSPAPVRHGLDLDHSSRHRTDDRRRCLCATALNNHSGKSRQLKVSRYLATALGPWLPGPTFGSCVSGPAPCMVGSWSCFSLSLEGRGLSAVGWTRISVLILAMLCGPLPGSGLSVELWTRPAGVIPSAVGIVGGRTTWPKRTVGIGYPNPRTGRRGGAGDALAQPLTANLRLLPNNG
jgi:hypothetical protein